MTDTTTPPVYRPVIRQEGDGAPEVVWHRHRDADHVTPDVAQHLPHWGRWRPLVLDSVLTPTEDVRYCVEYRCGISEMRPHQDDCVDPELGNVVDTRIGDRTVDPFAVPVCPHDAKATGDFMVDAQVVRLVEDDSGRRTGWQVQVKVICGQCGQPFRFVTGQAEVPIAGLSYDRRTLGAYVEPAPT